MGVFEEAFPLLLSWDAQAVRIGMMYCLGSGCTDVKERMYDVLYSEMSKAPIVVVSEKHWKIQVGPIVLNLDFTSHNGPVYAQACILCVDGTTDFVKAHHGNWHWDGKGEGGKYILERAISMAYYMIELPL